MSAKTATASEVRDPLLTTKEAAEYLGVTPRCAEAWRVRGGGPPFVRISARAVRYRLSDLNHWIAQRVRTSTSDPGRGTRRRT